MGFAIKMNTGEAGEVWLRGCEDGCVEMCRMETIAANVKKGTAEREALVPFKYYANIEQAINKIISMRIASSKATTLKALLDDIKAIRAGINKELGATTAMPKGIIQDIESAADGESSGKTQET